MSHTENNSPEAEDRNNGLPLVCQLTLSDLTDQRTPSKSANIATDDTLEY
jgi:hypothetical protein